MANEDRVCILSEGEVEDLKAGRQLDHRLHRHCWSDEAFDMTAPPWYHLDGRAVAPTAKWVGKNHIQETISHAWTTVKPQAGDGSAIGLTTRQLKPGVERGRRVGGMPSRYAGLRRREAA